MKLISVGPRGAELPAVMMSEDSYVPLTPFLDRYGIQGGMNAVLGILPLVHEDLWEWATRAEPQSLSGVRLGPPVPRPTNVIAVGANTKSHVAEASAVTGGFVAKTPMLFAKASSSLCGPHDPILRPSETIKLDYETELAVVIGKAATRVGPEEALGFVAGYMACNDVTARDVQTGEGEDTDFYWQHFRGKSYETFLPTGPWLITADEVPDLSRVTLQTYINDELRQDSDLTDLVFDIPTLISSISHCVPLRPGDVLVTGSPAGVAHFMNPPTYLEPGDTVRTVVGGVGELINVVAKA